ncbi:unnamed protein product [Caenorhabditis nigoni]
MEVIVDDVVVTVEHCLQFVISLIGILPHGFKQQLVKLSSFFFFQQSILEKKWETHSVVIIREDKPSSIQENLSCFCFFSSYHLYHLHKSG